MDQKALKEKYMDIICKDVWDSPRMQKFAYDEYGYGVELDDGDIAVINKPHIKKDFCFGYGYCGMSTLEDEERASDMVVHANTSEVYFINKNMEDLDRQIDRLYSPRMVAYKGIPYHGQPKDSKLKGIYFFDETEKDQAEDKGLVKMSKREVDAMIDGYTEMKRIFKKRLDKYLKRYGLSKVNAWSYLRD